MTPTRSNFSHFVTKWPELLADLLGANVSTGWLCQVQQEASGKLAPFIAVMKGQLKDAPVLHADETGTRVKTAKRWVHTLSTNLLALIAVHRERGAKALEDIGVLADYVGVVVHDGWSSHEKYTGATHAQCGVHLIRHLRSVGRDPRVLDLVRPDDKGPPRRQGRIGGRRLSRCKAR